MIPVLITLIVYKIVLIGIGLLAQRRTRDDVDFYLGGRRLGPLVSAVSASASSSSAWTLLAVSGTAYAHGLSALWLFPACIGGFVLNWVVVAPRIRRLSASSGAVTLTEILAGPPERPLRSVVMVVGSCIVLFCLSFYVGSQFFGAGKTFAATFGLEARTSIAIGSAVVLLYTLLGGFWAVSLTDTLQGLLMALTAALLPVAAALEVGGWEAFETGLRAVPIDHYLDPLRNFTGPAAIGFVLGTLGIGIGYPGQPHVVNRFMALREGDEALRHARWIAIAWAVVVYSGMIALGLAGRVLYESMVDAETLFIHATNELFPPILAGVMIAAVLSAIMSTADSQLLVAASAITHDLGWGRHDPRSVLWRARLVVLLIGIFSVAVAFVMLEHTIFNTVLFAWSALGASFGPVLLVTLLRGPVSPRGTLVAMVLGFTSSVVAHTAIPSPGKVLENVVPFVLAFCVAWCQAHPERRVP